LAESSLPKFQVAPNPKILENMVRKNGNLCAWHLTLASFWPIYTDSDFDSVGCNSRIQHRTKIGLFLSLDAAVASDTVKITVRVNGLHET
jgi:hypothetical protein